MTKLTGLNFKQIIDLIISGGEKDEKCDTKDEYKALANLLAGHQEEMNPDETLYALGLMVDYETNRAKQSSITPANEVKPLVENPNPVDELDLTNEPNSIGEPAPVDVTDPVDDPEPTEYFSFDSKMDLELFFSQMEARSVDDWLKHYLAPNFGFDINLLENLEGFCAGNKKAIDNMLEKKIVNKDELKSILTQDPSLVPYLVDETIAERIDKAFNMDKQDVYELVIVPLTKCLEGFNNSDFKDLIKRCESIDPKEMSIQKMQKLINELVSTIKEVHNKQADTIRNCAECLANVSHGIANDSKNTKVTVEKQEGNKTEYCIRYKNESIRIVKDANGKYSLILNGLYDKFVEDNSVAWSSESVLEDLIKMVESKISNSEIEPEYVKPLESKDQNPPVASSGLPQYERREDLAGQTVKQEDGTSLEYDYKGYVIAVYDENGIKTRDIESDVDRSVFWSIDYEYDEKWK